MFLENLICRDRSRGNELEPGVPPLAAEEIVLRASAARLPLRNSGPKGPHFIAQGNALVADRQEKHDRPERAKLVMFGPFRADVWIRWARPPRRCLGLSSCSLSGLPFAAVVREPIGGGLTFVQVPGRRTETSHQTGNTEGVGHLRGPSHGRIIGFSVLPLCGGDAAASVGFRPMLSKDGSVTTES